MSMPVYLVQTEEPSEDTFWMKVALADDVIPMEFLLEEDDALEHLIVRVLAKAEEVGWQSEKAKIYCCKVQVLRLKIIPRVMEK